MNKYFWNILEGLEGDFCAKLNITIIGFEDFPEYHVYSGIYLTMHNETTNHGVYICIKFYLL